jgi:hypothetical protein
VVRKIGENYGSLSSTLEIFVHRGDLKNHGHCYKNVDIAAMNANLGRAAKGEEGKISITLLESQFTRFFPTASRGLGGNSFACKPCRHSVEYRMASSAKSSLV